MSLSPFAFQQCVSAACGCKFELNQTLTGCPECGNLLDIQYQWDKLPIPASIEKIGQSVPSHLPQSQSGVWRYHELLPFADIESCLTVGEGKTILQQADGLAPQLNMKPGLSLIHI